MVKMKNILLILTCINIIFCYSGNIQAQEKVNWKIDFDYSANLTITSTNYKAISGVDISESVDIIKIFKNYDCSGDILSLSNVLTKKLIYESDNKKFIKDLLDSAQVEEMHVNECYQNKSCDNYYIVDFDIEHSRAGYFVLYPCNIPGEHIGIIRPVAEGDNSTIYYSKSIISLMKSNQIIEK